MITPMPLIFVFFIFYAPLISAAEIEVNLFESKCRLSGKKLDEKTLRAVHGISPVNISTVKSASKVETEIKKLSLSRKIVPKGLKSYLDRLEIHLKGWDKFFEGFEKASQSKKPEDFLEAIKPYVHTENFGELKTQAAQFQNPQAHGELKSSLQESFSRVSEPNPENEFHRLLRKLGIQYHCDFQEN